jgi:hypothetical protein
MINNRNNFTGNVNDIVACYQNPGSYDIINTGIKFEISEP